MPMITAAFLDLCMSQGMHFERTYFHQKSATPHTFTDSGVKRIIKKVEVASKNSQRAFVMLHFSSFIEGLHRGVVSITVILTECY